MAPLRSLFPLLVSALLLVAGSSSQAQNMPENQSIATNSLAQKPIAIQGFIILPHNADSVEFRAAYLLRKYLRNYVTMEETLYYDSLYSFLNPDSTSVKPAIFVGNTHLAQTLLTRKNEIRDDGFILNSNGRRAVIYGLKGKAVYYGAARL